MARSQPGRSGVGAAAGVLLALAACLPAARAQPTAPPPDRGALIRDVLTHPQIIVQKQPDGSYALQFCRCAIPVGYDDLPAALRWALVSTEDKRFFTPWHVLGFDPLGTSRAFLRDELSGGRQGGSGLDQQIAKNLIDGTDRSLARKLDEAWDAMHMEREFSKQEILAAYFNSMDFGAKDGRRIIGIEQAARAYFGKSTRSLNLYEAAVLVGMLKAPTRYDPARHPEAARERARHVLERMVADDRITARQMQAALLGGARPGKLQPVGLDTAFYTSWVRRELPALALPADAPAELRVVIGLDPVLQLHAREAVGAMLQSGSHRHATEAALVAMDADGLVRALVGGADFAQSQFDRATMGRRQPGSAFKPFVYLRALELGHRPGEMVLDAPQPNGWPRDFAGRYAGWVPLQRALVESLNGAAVRVAQEVGLPSIADLAHLLGIASPLDPVAALALGASPVTPLELTAAYAAIADGGRRVTPTGILAVLTMDGTVLATRQPVPGDQVVPPAAAQGLTRMLHEVIRSGTGTAACYGGWAAGKTGTTQDERDAWFVGFDAAPSLVTAIWIGNDDHSAMEGVSGSTLPAIAWRHFYAAADPRRVPGRRPCAAR